jgi:rubrerythrin
MPYKNPERAKQHRKDYYKANREEAKRYLAEWREKNKDRRNETDRKRNFERLRTDPEYRERRRLHSRESYQRHKQKRLELAAKHRNEKAKARRRLRTAINNGTIRRSFVCEKCGFFSLRIQAHHPDYSKPLEVVWLCPFCHPTYE